jgi:aminopeptidase N
MTATYAADVHFSWANRTLTGTVTISAVNRSGTGVDRVYLNTVMARLGSLHLGTITVDGARRTASIDDQTIVVPFGGVLPDGGTITVKLGFGATLRSSTSGSSWMFTRTNGIADLYRWIPWISQRIAFDRPNHGDPFLTLVSPRVTLRIRTDQRLVIAVTGARTASSPGGLDQTFVATTVRDLVLVAAGDFRVSDATVGDNVVRVVTRPGAPAAAMMTAAKAALTKLEARLGPYPYKVLKVIQTAGGFGMEGPGVAWIPGPVGTSNLTYLVTHEIAHQWFYGMVGNNQATEPFADEAATDFTARSVLGLKRSSRCATDTLDRSIYHYSSTCYYETIYIQGGNLLDSARAKMGSTAFWAAIRRYISDHRWGIVRTRMLLDALDAATPVDLRSWWRPRFPSLY